MKSNRCANDCLRENLLSPLGCCLLVVLLVANVSAVGQIVRLPSDPAIRTASVEYSMPASSAAQPGVQPYDGFQSYDTMETYELSQPLRPAGPVVVYPPETPIQQKPQLPPGAKPGMLQRVTFTETWLGSGGEEGLGGNTLDLSAILAAPIFSGQPPFLISPRFAAHFLDGPAVSDLPPRVYDTALEFRWLRPINDRWTADLAVAPGFYSDFDNTSSQAIRVMGRGIGIYKWSPTVTVALGIVYLDREDVKLLPAAGLIWKPNDDVNVELIFPRPKIARRIFPGLGFDWWAYIAGEFGGGSWAIRRTSGADDIATERDLRVILGLERKVEAGISTRAEVAYVFARKLEYLSEIPPDITLDDTVMLRVGGTY